MKYLKNERKLSDRSINYIEWGESNKEIGTNGAVYISKKMYETSTSVTSTLCYGIQWDTMCRYIGDEALHTVAAANGDGIVTLSGRCGNVDKFKNIFDL